VEHQLRGIALGCGHPDNGTVGPFAGLQATGLAVEAESASATQRAELNHIFGRQSRLGYNRARFGQEVKSPHADLGVGSQSYTNSGFEQGHERCDTMAVSQIGERTMCYGCPRFRQLPNVRRIDLHRMNAQASFAENSMLGQPAHWCEAG
jgi:hypothetical protein